ncbi:MAG: hypothetical protein WAM11_03025 [Cyanobium sp.]
MVSPQAKTLDPDRVLDKLSASKRRPIWMGYISPVDLLINQQPSQASNVEQLLDTWLKHTAIFLQARQLEPTCTRLVNLSYRDPDTLEWPLATAAELPLPLQLYLHRRCEVFNRYADLELQADLDGRQPQLLRPVAGLTNSDWMAFLLQAWETQARLAELQNNQDVSPETTVQLEPLQAELHTVRAQLSEAREEVELTLLQLHQVQQELETICLADRDKQQQLQAKSQELQALNQVHQAQQSAHQAELQSLRQQFEPQLANLEQQLQSSTGELSEAREEAEQILLQLHQVQEELEHYFLLCRWSEQQLATQAEALAQAEASGREQASRLQSLEAELVQLGGERDQAVNGREQHGRTVAELQRQLATQAEALAQAETSGWEQGARLQSLEAELVQVGSERDQAVIGREQQGRTAAELQQQLATQAEALSEAREEAELTLLQLHQVQEELEHYFLHSRSSDQLVAAQAEQNGRAFSLLGRMLQLSTASGAWLPEPQLPESPLPEPPLSEPQLPPPAASRGVV